MTEYGFWSLIPSVVAIILALRTKQIYLSLATGIWIGHLILQQGNPLLASFETLNAFVNVFKNEGNTQTIIYTLLVGALIALLQRSGGVQGLVKKLSEGSIDETPKGRLKAQLYAAITGLLIFVEANTSILVVGAVFRPLFDKLKISREKLAYLADSGSAPSCVIFPFNSWGAYIMSLLILNGYDQPFGVMMNSLVYNFYPFLAVAILLYIIVTEKDFGPMKHAEKRVFEQGKFLNDGSKPMISDEVSMIEPEEGTPKRAFNMIIPILILVTCMPILLLYTGWDAIDKTSSLPNQLLDALSNGSGTAAVVYSLTAAIIVSTFMYKAQGILKVQDSINLTLKGMSGMTSLALLMVFAFSLSSLCKELETGKYVAEISKAWLSPSFVPAIIFLVSCFIAFSTGTSWGTFAIMLAIAIPMAETMNANPYMAVAAAIGGGIFGDHCSPISDTTIISSMASATDHIDHVKTQLPYALVAGAASFLLYLILGLI
ncbi:Na+/H+ antiporter NhaC family protein [Reichenbachiella versicolor]|uniref:Na+/H+ antiporter NhaC family protein n=1 Tax=Reichenbachiella versicolor TaxID=1821036 RepID=UPI000D6E1C23|nr:Na+/H+ antiporter NhaC family protein [Reichenbachiella versicolor]